MDPLIRYRELVQKYLADLAALVQSQHSVEKTGVACECVFDRQRDHYLLMNVAWNGKRRERFVTLHVWIRGGKIQIEEDMTEEGLANYLVRNGVPPSDIAWLPTARDATLLRIRGCLTHRGQVGKSPQSGETMASKQLTRRTSRDRTKHKKVLPLRQLDAGD